MLGSFPSLLLLLVLCSSGTNITQSFKFYGQYPSPLCPLVFTNASWLASFTSPRLWKSTCDTHLLICL